MKISKFIDKPAWLLGIGFWLSVAAPVYAFPKPIPYDTFPQLATKIADFILSVALPLAIIMILYAGFLYMTSGGSEQKVRTAHAALIWGLIGLALVLIGKGVVLVVCNALGGGNCAVL